MSNEVATVQLYGGRVTLDFNPRNHRYYVGKANPDGVSTIAKAAAPFQGDDWGAKCGVDHVRQGYIKHFEKTAEIIEQTPFLALCEEAETAHQRIRDAAGDSGSVTHGLIEKHLTKQPYVIPDDERVIAGFNAFLSWIGQTDIEIIECERLVYSEKYFYAGCTDLVARRNGRLLVADFKTGSGIYADVPYQLRGYAEAIEEETGDTIEHGLAIHLDKRTGRFTEYPIPLDEDMKGAWKAAVVHYKNLKRIKKQVQEMTYGKRAA
jgi:hypothetical protein